MYPRWNAFFIKEMINFYISQESAFVKRKLQGRVFIFPGAQYIVVFRRRENREKAELWVKKGDTVGSG
ncbi:MAG TPA: hypothetical protein DCO77_05905 [Nitrospiraceae bacterium]|nr:hypothetical protein [Nitrospiraceae bacterium]